MAIEWFNLTNGSFNGFKFHIAEPKGDEVHGVSDISWNFSRRLQRSKKPLVDGVSVRDLGGNEREFTFNIIFFGDNYLEKYLEFEETVSNGTPGDLIIPNYPRPIQCYFSSASVNSSFQQHNTFLVNVSFVQDETSEQEQSFATTKVLTQEELGSLIQENALLGVSEISDNEFVSAVNSIGSGLSAVRRFSSRIINLDQAVRNRIASVSANISDTFSLLNDAINVVENLGGLIENFSSGFLDEESDRSIVQVTTNSEVTGVEGGEESEDSTLVTSAETSAALESITNNDSVVSELTKIVESLESNILLMNNDTGGNTQEVQERIKAIRLLLNDYLINFKAPELTQILVAKKTSLIEVMFKLGIDVDDLPKVHVNNLHLSDSLIIDSGEVVYL